MRLLGMPCGSSPMWPEAWAPMGLKYRSNTAFQVYRTWVRRWGAGVQTVSQLNPEPFTHPSNTCSLSLESSRGWGPPPSAVTAGSWALASSSVDVAHNLILRLMGGSKESMHRGRGRGKGFLTLSAWHRSWIISSMKNLDFP